MGSAPRQLGSEMNAAGVKRGWICYDQKSATVKSSHPVLQDVAEWLAADTVDFDKHEGIFLQAMPDNTILGAYLWKTVRGQGCGGIRLRHYATLEEYIRDGLRLATGMGRKSALAGLWWGGGKGVIAAADADVYTHRAAAGWEAERLDMLHSYGEFLTSLRGCYVAAEDAGIAVADVDAVFSRTRFTTCISPTLGGSGNPSVPTAMGIVCGMEAAVDHLGLEGGLKGKTVALQGIGNVGEPLIGFLLEKGIGKVVAADADPAKVDFARQKYGYAPNVYIHMADEEFDILKEEADIFSPCGYGGALTRESVGHIKAKIVCGAANNQLLDPKDDGGMTERGILYCPDFVVNRMGIVNCANEQYGRVGQLGTTVDPIIAVHLGREDDNSVYKITRKVLGTAEEEGITTAQAADQLADMAAAVPHPLFGHRSQAIIDQLIVDKWHD